MVKSALSQKLLKYYFKQFGVRIAAYGPKNRAIKDKS